jgi:KRAB domain-containing zinc finger protein
VDIVVVQLLSVTIYTFSCRFGQSSLAALNSLEHVFCTVSLVKGKAISAKKGDRTNYCEETSSSNSTGCSESHIMEKRATENTYNNLQMEMSESDHSKTVAKELVVEQRQIFECEHCGKNLTSRENMRSHLRIHTGECPFTCHVCGKCFRTRSGLNRHLKDVHEHVKNFKCEMCSRKFANQRTLDDHRRIHTGERPFICDLCGKSFKTKAALYSHKLIHTGVFAFKCSFCNVGFYCQSKFVLHMLIHTGEKPHICDTCGKGFRMRHILARHKLVHSDMMPFSCTECGHKFRQERYLRRHMKVTHGKLKI